MAMPDSWREMFAAHAQSALYQERLEQARSRLLAAPDGMLHVAFSGGKDSLVCLDLALETLGPERLWVAHYDFGRPDAKVSNVFPEWFEREVEQTVRGHFGLALTVITKPRNFRTIEQSSANRQEGTRVILLGDGEFWIRGVAQRARQAGCVASIVGLRAKESGARRRRVKQGDWISGGLPEVWPIADWSETDVWAHIVARGLPYTRAYDEQAALFGTYLGLRTRSLFDDGCKAVSDGAVDGVLHWRDRPQVRPI